MFADSAKTSTLAFFCDWFQWTHHVTLLVFTLLYQFQRPWWIFKVTATSKATSGDHICSASSCLVVNAACRVLIEIVEENISDESYNHNAVWLCGQHSEGERERAPGWNLCWHFVVMTSVWSQLMWREIYQYTERKCMVQNKWSITIMKVK